MGRKRTQKNAAENLDIQRRRKEVAELYLRSGKTQTEIADLLDISRATVARDLESLAAEWHESRLKDIDRSVTVELRRIAKAESEAWDAWDKSKGLVEKSRSSRKIRAGVETVAKQVETTNQCGDPRHLNAVLACIDKRCQLLGLYKPVKVDMGMTVQQRQERLIRLAERYNLN